MTPVHGQIHAAITRIATCYGETSLEGAERYHRMGLASLDFRVMERLQQSGWIRKRVELLTWTWTRKAER